MRYKDYTFKNKINLFQLFVERIKTVLIKKYKNELVQNFQGVDLSELGYSFEACSLWSFYRLLLSQGEWLGVKDF